MHVVIRPPGCTPYAVSLDRLIALVRAWRALRTMGRLASKLAKANDALAGVELAVEQDVDRLIERTKTVHAKREAVFLQKHQGLDGHMSDLATFEADLDDFGKNDRGVDGENTGSAYTGTR